MEVGLEKDQEEELTFIAVCSVADILTSALPAWSF
jgi:hypothetical protein